MNLLGKSRAVGAMALVATGAQARIAGVKLTGFENDPRGSELFLSVYNPDAQISYAMDLGIRHADFLDNPQAMNHSINTDAFSQFMAATSPGDRVIYNIASAHNSFVDFDSVNYLGILMTSKNEIAVGPFGGFSESSTTLDQHIDQLNARSGELTGTNQQVGDKAVNLDSYSAPGQSGYFPTTWGSNIGNSFSGNLSSSAGESTGFWWWGFDMDPNTFELTEKAVYLGDWNFSIENGSASLNFAPVPVPAAVWFFGTGLMGLIAAKRRKA